MKRMITVFVLLAALLFSSSAADPMVQAEDLAGVIRIPYDENDPSAGAYVYTYRYPQIDESDPSAMRVNLFYADLVEMLDTNLTFSAEGYAASGKSVDVTVNYKVTCNNDEYFSLVVIRKVVSGDSSYVVWQGHTFPRNSSAGDGTCDLTVILGLLSNGDQDENRQSRQTEKVNQAVRRLVMKQIDDNPKNMEWLADFTEDDLQYSFYPTEDFYLDKRGNPVFFLEPGVVADESQGYIRFSVPLDDITDEL